MTDTEKSARFKGLQDECEVFHVDVAIEYPAIATVSHRRPNDGTDNRCPLRQFNRLFLTP